MPLNYSVLNNKNTTNSYYLGDTIYNLLNESFKLPANGFSFNIFTVTRDYVARPDLVSLDAYNDTRYADVLCKLNGISNPFELNEGMELIIPSTQYIEDFCLNTIYNIDMFDEDEFESSMPYESKKNSKRKANEAIVGDSRFKIDSANGIIIY